MDLTLLGKKRIRCILFSLCVCLGGIGDGWALVKDPRLDIEETRIANQILPVHYLLSPNDPIDVVIPCALKDLDTLEMCIEGIRQNGKNVRRIITISPQPLSASAEWFDESLFPFSKLSIALEIFHDEQKAQEYIDDENTRIGWIYQQFLKLYAPFVIPRISSNVLVLDADTIFLRPVCFISKSGGPLLNIGIEHYPPYFEHMQRLLPWLVKTIPKNSGITHHMLFQRAILEDFFKMIEDLHRTDAWKGICQCIDAKEVYGCSLSEYEMYFNFALLKTNQAKLRPLKWKNIDRLTQITLYRQQGYHYVSAHDHSRID